MCVSDIFNVFFDKILKKWQLYMYILQLLFSLFGLMDKMSASQPRDRGFEPHTGHDHESSYDTSTGWFQEADSRVI